MRRIIPFLALSAFALTGCATLSGPSVDTFPEVVATVRTAEPSVAGACLYANTLGFFEQIPECPIPLATPTKVIRPLLSYEASERADADTVFAAACAKSGTKLTGSDCISLYHDWAEIGAYVAGKAPFPEHLLERDRGI